MNENIKELAKQAGINQDQDEDGTRFLSMPESSWEKFAELILSNADKLNRMSSTDLINRPFEIDPKFIKLCALNGPRRRQTYDDQDFQDLVDIDGKSIPHVSKLRKQKKGKE
jgi:hypothetical protein